MGKYAEAEPLLKEALRIDQKVFGQNIQGRRPASAILAALEFDLGQIDEATALARQASAAELTILSKIFSFTSEQQRLAYLDTSLFTPIVFSLF